MLKYIFSHNIDSWMLRSKQVRKIQTNLNLTAHVPQPKRRGMVQNSLRVGNRYYTMTSIQMILFMTSIHVMLDVTLMIQLKLSALQGYESDVEPPFRKSRTVT